MLVHGGFNFCVVQALNAGPFGDADPQFNSLSEICCLRLHQVGFERGPNGIVHDQIGEFRVLLCPFGELRFRLQLAWVSIMAVHVQHRPSFRGFRLVDVVHTRAAYLRFDPFDQGVLRKHLHGATLTNSMPNIGPKIAALYVPNAPPWTPFITGCGNVLPRKPCVTSCLWTSFALSTHCRLSCESMVGLFVPVLPMLGSNISIASLAKFSFLHCHVWPPSWTCSLMGLVCILRSATSAWRPGRSSWRVHMPRTLAPKTSLLWQPNLLLACFDRHIVLSCLLL